MRKAYRCKVTGLVDDGGNELPEQVVVAVNRSMAKVVAAKKVGGYWTEDTDCEIIETVEVANADDEVLA